MGGRGRGRLAPAALIVTVAVMLAAGGGTVAGAPHPPASAETGQPRVVDEVVVTAMHHGAGFSNNSPLIMADPTEPRFLAMANRLDAPDFGCALQVSGDRGRTWTTAKPVATLPEGAQKCYAPEIAFDAGGTLYYLFVGLAGRGNRPMGAFLTTSTDRAQSFTSPRPVLGPLNFAVRMTINRESGDRGRIHLVWIKATSEPSLGGFGPPPNPILSAHSDNGGRSFSEPVQVSDPRRERVVAPALALGPQGAVHVAYYDLERDALDYQGLEGPVREEPWSLVVSSSFDGGATFGPGGVVDDRILAAERVMLIFTMPPPALVAGGKGLLCAAWTDARHGDADALSRCSRNRGRTWQPARRINDDAVGNGARQYLPRVSLSPEGRLDAVFFDRRDDPSNVRNHVFLTYSTDGGESFATTTRISGAPSDSRVGAQYANPSARGQHEIGSRLGLLSGRSHAVVAWPDTRHSTQSTTAQDLFSATVALPVMPEDRGAVGLIVVAAVVVGAIAGSVAWISRRRRTLAATT